MLIIFLCRFPDFDSHNTFIYIQHINNNNTAKMKDRTKKNILKTIHILCKYEKLMLNFLISFIFLVAAALFYDFSFSASHLTASKMHFQHLYAHKTAINCQKENQTISPGRYEFGKCFIHLALQCVSLSCTVFCISVSMKDLILLYKA